MKYKPVGYDREKESNGEYKNYIHKAIEKLIKDGYGLPVLKKSTGANRNFQFRGHEHVADALQGYWERNKKTYIHRARSDYRALYLGLIVMLKEEELLSGADNSKEISALEIYVEERKTKHILFKKMGLLKQEIVALLTEVDTGLITEQEFDRDVQELISTFKDQETKINFAEIIDNTIIEEVKKLKNRKYQQKRRHFEKLTKGIRIVGQEV